MIFSIIQKSQLEGVHRLDAEYYQPEYFIDFSKGKWKSIGEILELCQYGISQSMNDQKRGYPIFKMDDIDYGFLFDDEVRFADITDSVFTEFKLQKNDVLFNRVNSEEFVGRTGIYKLTDLRSVFASYLIRIRVKENGDILPDYLNIFLNSAYGLKQIRRFARRAVNQANVNAEELKQIKIAILPKLEQEKIAELSNKSWQEFQGSKIFYSQAENLLLEELGLKDFKEDNSLFSIVNLSDVKSSHRIDAEYFQEKYGKMIEVVKIKREVESLDNLFDFNRGIFISTDYYTEEKTQTPYIRIKELSEKGGINKDEIIYINKKYIGDEKNKLKENDLVLAIIGDTIGKTNKIDKELSGGYCSNNTGRLRIKKEWGNKILPECNELIFQSILIQSQIEKKKAQTGQPKINDSEIRSILIPILSKLTQQKIANLIQKSHEARKKAKELLKQAKLKVEEMIEK